MEQLDVMQAAKEGDSKQLMLMVKDANAVRDVAREELRKVEEEVHGELRARKNGLADALAPVLAAAVSAAGLAAGGLVMPHAVPLFAAASMQEVGAITQITQQSQWAEAIQRAVCTGKQGVLLVSDGLGRATR